MNTYTIMRIIALVILVLGVVFAIFARVLIVKRNAKKIETLEETKYQDLTLAEINEFKRLKKSNTFLPIVVFLLFLLAAILLFVLSVFLPFFDTIRDIL